MKEHNTYYCNEGFEVIDVIEAYNLDFMDGNVLKYIARAGKKTPDSHEDYKKAVYYAKRRRLRSGRDIAAVPMNVMEIVEAFSGDKPLCVKCLLFDVLVGLIKDKDTAAFIDFVNSTEPSSV